MNDLTEIVVRPEQAQYLANLNAEAAEAARVANERFQIAASAVLMGQVPAGSEIKEINVKSGLLRVQVPEPEKG